MIGDIPGNDLVKPLYHPHFGGVIGIQGIDEVSEEPDQQVAETIAIMSRYVREDAGNPLVKRVAQEITAGALNQKEQVCRVWQWVKQNLVFVRDEDSIDDANLNNLFSDGEAVEVLVRPAEMLQVSSWGNGRAQGDCDDFQMLAAALLVSLGIRCSFATVAGSAQFPDRYSHVYAVAYLDSGERVPVDSSHGDHCGWEAPDRFGKFREWPISSTHLLELGLVMALLYLALRPILLVLFLFTLGTIEAQQIKSPTYGVTGPQARQFVWSFDAANNQLVLSYQTNPSTQVECLRMDTTGIIGAITGLISSPQTGAITWTGSQTWQARNSMGATATPQTDSLLYFRQAFTPASYDSVVNSLITVTPTANSSVFEGVTMLLTDAGTFPVDDFIGFLGNVTKGSTGTADEVTGGKFQANVNAGTGTDVYGVENIVTVGASGTVTNAYGNKSQITDNGATTNAYAYHADVAGATNNFGFYSTGATVRNVMQGTIEAPKHVFASGTEPACAAGTRGTMVQVYGGAGVADTIRVCGKDAADAYAYVAVATF